MRLNQWRVHYHQQNTISLLNTCISWVSEKAKIAGYKYWLYKLLEIGLLVYIRLTQWLKVRKVQDQKTRPYLHDHKSFPTVQDQTMLYQWNSRHLSPLRDCSICWFIQAPTLRGPAVTTNLSPVSASLNGKDTILLAVYVLFWTDFQSILGSCKLLRIISKNSEIFFSIRKKNQKQSNKTFQRKSFVHLYMCLLQKSIVGRRMQAQKAGNDEMVVATPSTACSLEVLSEFK